MRFGTFLCVGGLTGASLGCYQFVPAEITAVPVGSRIRAVLTPEAQQRLRERHALDSERFEGTLVERNGDQVSLYVSSGRVAAAFGSPQALYQQVELRYSEVVRADLRRLDRFRTATLVVVSAAVAGVVIGKSVFGGDPGGTPPGGPDGQESVRAWVILLPLLRW